MSGRTEERTEMNRQYADPVLSGLEKKEKTHTRSRCFLPEWRFQAIARPMLSRRHAEQQGGSHLEREQGVRVGW